MLIKHHQSYQYYVQKLESFFNLKPSPEQPLTWPWTNPDNIDFWIKRDDLIHPTVSGNKWRKLKFALQQIKNTDTRHVVSFGGGYSNHLHALAYCCKALNIQLHAIVRGDYSQQLTPMLRDLQQWGADVQFVNRQVYQQRNCDEYLARLRRENHNAVVIPEGGSQDLALEGVGEIIGELTQPYDYIITPVGSGGTLAGLALASQYCDTRIIGIATLKGKGYLEELVSGLVGQRASVQNWLIEHEYHFGGYAKKTDELSAIIDEFERMTSIAVEPVYSGKMIAAVKDLVDRHYFKPQSNVLLLHTGGLQGARS